MLIWGPLLLQMLVVLPKSYPVRNVIVDSFPGYILVFDRILELTIEWNKCLLCVCACLVTLTMSENVENTKSLRRNMPQPKPGDNNSNSQQPQKDARSSPKNLEGSEVPSVHVIWDATGVSKRTTILYPAPKRSSETFESSGSQSSVFSPSSNPQNYASVPGKAECGDSLDSGRRSPKVLLQKIEEALTEKINKSSKDIILESSPTSYPAVQEKEFLQKLLTSTSSPKPPEATEKQKTTTNTKFTQKIRKRKTTQIDSEDTSSNSSRDSVLPCKSSKRKTSVLGNTQSQKMNPSPSSPVKKRSLKSPKHSPTSPRSPDSGYSLQITDNGVLKPINNNKSFEAPQRPKSSIAAKHGKVIQSLPSKPISMKIEGTNDSIKSTNSNPEVDKLSTSENKIISLNTDKAGEFAPLAVIQNKTEMSESPSATPRFEIQSVRIKRPSTNEDGLIEEAAEIHIRPIHATMHVNSDKNNKGFKVADKRGVKETAKEIIRISIARNTEPLEIVSQNEGESTKTVLKDNGHSNLKGIELPTNQNLNISSTINSKGSNTNKPDGLKGETTSKPKDSSEQRSQTNSDVGIQVSLGELPYSNRTNFQLPPVKDPTNVTEIGVQVSITKLNSLRNYSNTSSSRFSSDLSDTSMQPSTADENSAKDNSKKPPIVKSPMNISVNSQLNKVNASTKAAKVPATKTTNISEKSFQQKCNKYTNTMGKTSGDCQDKLQNFAVNNAKCTLSCSDNIAGDSQRKDAKPPSGNSNETENLPKSITKPGTIKSRMPFSKTQTLKPTTLRDPQPADQSQNSKVASRPSSAKSPVRLKETIGKIQTKKDSAGHTTDPMSTAEENREKLNLGKVPDNKNVEPTPLIITTTPQQENGELETKLESLAKRDSSSTSFSKSNSRNEGLRTRLSSKDIRIESRLTVLENRLRLEELRNRSWTSRVTQAEDRLLRLSAQFRELQQVVSTLQCSRSLSDVTKISPTASISKERPVSLQGLKDLIQQLRDEINEAEKLSTSDLSLGSETRQTTPSSCLSPNISITSQAILSPTPSSPAQ